MLVRTTCMARSTLQNVCHRGRKRYQVVDRPQFASAYAIEIPGMKYIKILSIEIENKYLFGKIISWNVNLQKNLWKHLFLVNYHVTLNLSYRSEWKKTVTIIGT